METTTRLPPRDERVEILILWTILCEPEKALPIAEEFGLDSADFYPPCFLAA